MALELCHIGQAQAGAERRRQACNLPLISDLIEVEDSDSMANSLTFKRVTSEQLTRSTFERLMQ
jgi:hypothetical protein